MIAPVVDVLGLAVWTPGSTTAAAPAASRPAGGRARRRSSLLTQMVADVAAQAAAQAGASLGRVRVVVGSAFGELGTTVEMLGELTDGGGLSPTRFHNSVHNSAAGALSIAHENRAAAISLAAGNDTVAMALLEAMMIVRERDGDGDPVLLIVADEPLPVVLGAAAGGEPIAGALVLAAPGSSRTPLTRLTSLTAPVSTATTPAAFRPVEVDAPVAAVLPLAAAIRERRAGPILLAPPGMPGWSVTVQPGPLPP
ncbi:MAG TPA: beta-ketoacyl synthase chain length factor [Polyangia bacterium]|jgi:hypothetical protein|nr:beta-ketoacyl synthase chain length factor [Polyangia bacterium]